MEQEYTMEETKPGRAYELSLSKGFGNGGEYKCVAVTVAEDEREGTLAVMVEGKCHN